MCTYTRSYVCIYRKLHGYVGTLICFDKYVRMYIAIHAELFTTHTELRIVIYIQYIANIRITLYQESIIEKRVSNSTIFHQK